MRKLFSTILGGLFLIGCCLTPVFAQTQQSQSAGVSKTARIPILEYHHIDSVSSRWGRSVQEFKDDLLWLYNNGYVSLSMGDFTDSNFRGVPAGKKPVVLTFDDGLVSQFKYLDDGSIDPDCAVGILDDFYKQHPDFGRSAIFYVNAVPFGQADSVMKKFQYLVDTGRQVGFHTLKHTNLKPLKLDAVQKILLDQSRALQTVLVEGTQLDSLAFPFGGVPNGGLDSIAHVTTEHDGSYDIRTALLVGAEPAVPLNMPGVDRYRIPRIQAIDSEFLRHFGRKAGDTAAGTAHEKFIPMVGEGTATQGGLQTQQAQQNVSVFTWKNIFNNSLFEKLFRRLNVYAVRAMVPPYRGIYLTAYAAGSDMGQNLLRKLKDAGGNLIVFDMKEIDGHLYYPTSNEINKSVGGNDRILFKDPKAFVEQGKKMGFHMVARVACFKDELMAKKKPEWAIHDFKGGVWKSPEGQVWLDPSLPEVQDYILSVAKEVAALGVDEVQFDYVRFPTQGRVSDANYSFDEKKTEHYEIIRDFLKKADTELHPLGVKVAVDIFGVVVWNNQYDAGSTGQKMSEIAPYIDVVYPMVYPSHFGPGFAGHKKPGDDPYYFVHESVRLFQELVVDYPVIVRPWLQAFPFKVSHYNGEYVQQQVNAGRDAGSEGFVLWNAGNNYDVAWSVFGQKQ